MVNRSAVYIGRGRGIPCSFGLVFITVLLVGCTTTSAPVLEADNQSLSTEAFANVFIESQSVRVRVGFGDKQTGAYGPTVLALYDIDGRVIANRKAGKAPAEVDFGFLPPGYYQVSDGRNELALAVLIDRKRHVKGPARVSTDNAMPWLVNERQYEDVARLLRLCGITWVRERLRWKEIEEKQGEFHWGRYERVINALAKEGLQPYLVYHGIPGWAREDQHEHDMPDDLRVAYNFARRMAEHFKGRVFAYECWNEPDGHFFSGLPDGVAAFQKVSYLGFKAADPSLIVLGPSVCRYYRPMGEVWMEEFLSNGVGGYMDVFNSHLYQPPRMFAPCHAVIQRWLARYGLQDMPCWVTENGIMWHRLDKDRKLSYTNRLEQAAFISRMFPTFLSVGVERTFWFIFPYFVNPTGAVHGLFTRQPSRKGEDFLVASVKEPLPGLCALATSAYALGRGNYLGSIKGLPEKMRAFAFDRGNGSVVIAAWSESKAAEDLNLPWNWTDLLERRSYLGTPMRIEGKGKISICLGGEAQYLFFRHKTVESMFASSAVPPSQTASSASRAPELPKIVTRLVLPLKLVNKMDWAYVCDPSQDVQARLEVYNFGDKPFNGEVQLTAPHGWGVDRPVVSVTVLPMGRTVSQLKIRPTTTKNFDRVMLQVETVAPNGRRASPVAIPLIVDLNRIKPIEAVDLKLDDATKWRNNIHDSGDMKCEQAPGGGVRFRISFDRRPERFGSWAYPETRFAPALDLSSYEAIRFEYRTNVERTGSIKLSLVEPDGTTYLLKGDGLEGSTQWKTATVMFTSFRPSPVWPDRNNGRLDMDKIARLRIGGHFRPKSLTLDVRNFQAVRLRKPQD